ncbi:2-oxo acid dehydrogenase subunit E2 [Vreelandella rituensis]|uniref:Dihydrolipoamide acetyltransferase component of pyruvate dehydrogenase complex n=1 Tax=Vreelandella rituensis TaxID=2282306 RepID=A0A368UAS1_9GAMM|nr:2-oxo acid dehydrogenase subunit E2 [Halomonas rituensis]RCV93332.1 dihydrolipoyllysine-residue acetyltransferase [Halomonas rituensis]
MSDFMLPDIGEGIVECEVVEWHVAEGDVIEEDQPVVEVMTDKALVEITAPEAGRITRLYVSKGEIAKVHAPLFGYQTDEESTQGNEPQATPAPAATEPQEQKSPAAAGAMPERTPSPSSATPQESSQLTRGAYGRVPASPAVRRLVREYKLELEVIPGSGKDGRVLKEDVLNFVEQGESGQGDVSVASTSPVASSEEVRVEPLRGIRAVMAKRMVESATTIPHFQYGEEFDITDLLALRARLKPKMEALGERLTLMPFFMKAIALAAAEHPIVNARLNASADEIHYYSACNVGMAVDSKVGLLVPNVKQVETLSVLDIAREVSRLTSAAREGRVEQHDLKGGTISISNIGALGGTYASPIINAPESAIVAIGKTQWLPRFDENGEVQRRAIMTATWAGDHRLIDGGTIARFCNAWKGYLEAPETMLLQLR